MKKMSIADLRSFCGRWGFTLLALEDGTPDLQFNTKSGMLPNRSEGGRFWDFVPYPHPNALDYFYPAYEHLNGEWH